MPRPWYSYNHKNICRWSACWNQLGNNPVAEFGWPPLTYIRAVVCLGSLTHSDCRTSLAKHFTAVGWNGHSHRCLPTKYIHKLIDDLERRLTLQWCSREAATVIERDSLEKVSSSHPLISIHPFISEDFHGSKLIIAQICQRLITEKAELLHYKQLNRLINHMGPICKNPTHIMHPSKLLQGNGFKQVARHCSRHSN